jgi:hypothetical protein
VTTRRSAAALLSGVAFLSLALVRAGSAAGEERHYKASAASSAEIDIGADGALVMHARNVRLVPYAVSLDHYRPRLATVMIDVRQRTDAEGADRSSTVSVTVDDISADPVQRLASFTDPGTEGDLLTPDFFDSWMPGCCGGPTVHYVRWPEDGKLLFRATGDGAAGTSAWALPPDSDPANVRWAAFDGSVGLQAMARRVVGTITYGTIGGPLARLEIRVTAKGTRPEDLNLGLSRAARLVWVDAVSQKRGHPPASGTPAHPQTIWSLDGVMAPEGISGFSLRLLGDDGTPLATIPVVADALEPERARLAKGIAVEGVSPSLPAPPVE